MTATDSFHRLVIVESPGKIERIQDYLGSGYVVMASVGHVVDLPWESDAVDMDSDFVASYRLDPKSKQGVAELRRAMVKADELLLATDGDREGEAIAWHLVQVLEPTIPVRRMVFHEITREAVLAALDQTRDLDMELVQARETRRTLDWLVGFHITNLLQQRLSNARSAGRVQSPVLRMVVDRERERMAHRSVSYFGVTGRFLPGGFSAELVSISGDPLATGSDFDSQGELKSRRVGSLVVGAEDAHQLVDALCGQEFRVSKVERRSKVSRPQAPFDTGGLYRTAGSRLGWSQSKTKQAAQKLYERSYITYPRTDTVALSGQGSAAARAQAVDMFGPEAVPSSPRVYQGKEQNAQEAHEAVRPTGDRFRTPDEVGDELSDDEAGLYELIWRRTIASQMIDAEDSATSVRLAAVSSDGRPVEFRASGTVTVREGFRAAYPAASGRKVPLPDLREGQPLPPPELEARIYATAPPARYTENKLLEEMRKHGIGRPATYAETISKLSERRYVSNRTGSLAPTFLGMTVTRLMEKHFPELVDYSFTGAMEEALDQIASGEASRLTALRDFWEGDGSSGGLGLSRMLEEATSIDVASLSTFAVPGTDAVVRAGRRGAYLERPKGDGVEKVNLPVKTAPADVTAKYVEEMFARRDLGTDPQTGYGIVVRNGPHGPYVMESLGEGGGSEVLKRRSASLLKDMTLETMTLDEALRLLSLPRLVGIDPGDGEQVEVCNGRHGPYLRKGEQTVSLDSEEQIFSVSLEEALEKLAAANVELGADPESGRMIVMRRGRSGYYVTDGECNAGVPGADETSLISLEQAADLLAAKRARRPSKRRPKKRRASNGR